jgi:hypothetical protein
VFQIKKVYAKLRKFGGELCYCCFSMMLFNMFNIPCHVWKLILKKTCTYVFFSYKLCCTVPVTCCILFYTL